MMRMVSSSSTFSGFPTCEPPKPRADTFSPVSPSVRYGIPDSTDEFPMSIEIQENRPALPRVRFHSTAQAHMPGICEKRAFGAWLANNIGVKYMFRKSTCVAGMLAVGLLLGGGASNAFAQQPASDN